jgi:peptide/nickel transport system permease protein
MSGVASPVGRELVAVRYRSEWARRWRRFARNRSALFGLVIVSALVLVAIGADFISPYDPYAIDSSLRGMGPSWAHPFGMDEAGRDILSRVIHGARISLLVGFSGTGLALVVGVLVGAGAGYFGRAVDLVLMRVVDALMAFPVLVLLVALAAAVGPSLQNVIVIIGLTSWARYARVVRADVLSLREREFVLAARMVGATHGRVILFHILPNVLGPVTVLASLSVAGVILLEASLSFLGLGSQPPTASWGAMLSAGRTYILTYPHICVFPGLAITLTVLGFNMLGDGIRDAFDPRLNP